MDWEHNLNIIFSTIPLRVLCGTCTRVCKLWTKFIYSDPRWIDLANFLPPAEENKITIDSSNGFPIYHLTSFHKSHIYMSSFCARLHPLITDLDLFFYDSKSIPQGHLEKILQSCPNLQRIKLKYHVDSNFELLMKTYPKDQLLSYYAMYDAELYAKMQNKTLFPRFFAHFSKLEHFAIFNMDDSEISFLGKNLSLLKISNFTSMYSPQANILKLSHITPNLHTLSIHLGYQEEMLNGLLKGLTQLSTIKSLKISERGYHFASLQLFVDFVTAKQYTLTELGLPQNATGSILIAVSELVPNLVCLKLKNCFKIDFEVFETAAHNLLNLEKVNLEGCIMTVSSFANCGIWGTKLKTVKFPREISEENFKRFVDVTFETLENIKIELSGRYSPISLAYAAEKLKHLKVLTIHNLPATTNSLPKIEPTQKQKEMVNEIVKLITNNHGSLQLINLQHAGNYDFLHRDILEAKKLCINLQRDVKVIYTIASN